MSTANISAKPEDSTDNGSPRLMLGTGQSRYGCDARTVFVASFSARGPKCLLTSTGSFSKLRMLAQLAAGLDSADALSAHLTACLQRRWGLTAIRANARLLLDRTATSGAAGLQQPFGESSRSCGTFGRHGLGERLC